MCRLILKIEIIGSALLPIERLTSSHVLFAWSALNLLSIASIHLSWSGPVVASLNVQSEAPRQMSQWRMSSNAKLDESANLGFGSTIRPERVFNSLDALRTSCSFCVSDDVALIDLENLKEGGGWVWATAAAVWNCFRRASVFGSDGSTSGGKMEGKLGRSFEQSKMSWHHYLDFLRNVLLHWFRFSASSGESVTFVDW